MLTEQLSIQASAVVHRYSLWHNTAGQTQWTKPLELQGTASASQPAATAGSAAAAPFVASASFAGVRPGYVFKMGTEGTGYYLDQSSSTVQGIPDV